MTINQLEIMATQKFPGKPFGNAERGEISVTFVIAHSPAGRMRSYPRFSYYVSGKKVTRQFASEMLAACPDGRTAEPFPQHRTL